MISYESFIVEAYSVLRLTTDIYCETCDTTAKIIQSTRLGNEVTIECDNCGWYKNKENNHQSSQIEFITRATLC